MLREVEVNQQAELDAPVRTYRPRLLCFCHFEVDANPSRMEHDGRLRQVKMPRGREDAENLVGLVQDRTPRFGGVEDLGYSFGV